MENLWLCPFARVCCTSSHWHLVPNNSGSIHVRERSEHRCPFSISLVEHGQGHFEHSGELNFATYSWSLSVVHSLPNDQDAIGI